MTKTVCATVIYEEQDQQVSWQGVSMEDGGDFNAFMINDVASRLSDDEGTAEFESHLRSLAGTGFACGSLEAILTAEVPEERDWAVGEAMAEAYLGREHAIIWPWNMERDKRNPYASLPGADLVGFQEQGDNARLALGEVKTSADANTPPGVMNGRSGMMHQIDNLAFNLSLVCQLLKWLLPRCKGTKYEPLFDKAVVLLFDSGNKAISLYGVLIRDTQPNELDLRERARRLAGTLRHPATCRLIAIYVPCPINEIPARVARGGP